MSNKYKFYENTPPEKSQGAPPAPVTTTTVTTTPVIATSTAAPKKSAVKNVVVAGLLGLGTWLIIRKVQVQKQIKQGEISYMTLVENAAKAAGIPPSILAGIVTAESSWSNKPNKNSDKFGVNCIASSVGAIGLAQVLPTTAKGVGASGNAQELCDPAANLTYAARYLARLYAKYQDWETVAKAYNAGPGNVDKDNIGIGTKLYASKVVNAAASYQESGLAGNIMIVRNSIRGRCLRA